MYYLQHNKAGHGILGDGGGGGGEKGGVGREMFFGIW